MLLDLFKTLFAPFEDEGYFQEALGLNCVDAGFVPGNLGRAPDAALFLELRKKDLTPVRKMVDKYSEDDLFDIVEFHYEHCSKPIEVRHQHGYDGCCRHYESFDRKVGRQEFREEVNEVLALYQNGYELSPAGEILGLADTGFEGLIKAPLLTADPHNIDARVDAACTKFRRYKSSLDERRDAIRDLADVLEYLRPQLKEVLTLKDEDDLFNIANNFGIRHHNLNQKTGYDKPIWYRWMFYYYLATIHAVNSLIERHERGTKETGPRIAE
jgi:hypothetical protein